MRLTNLITHTKLLTVNNMQYDKIYQSAIRIEPKTYKYSNYNKLLYLYVPIKPRQNLFKQINIQQIHQKSDNQSEKVFHT
jgi:hypothetical protein